MKLSNNDMVNYVAILVIVVSLASIGMELTGYAATDTGVVEVTIESSAAINFTIDEIDFGSGQVDTGADYAVLYTNSTSGVGNVTDGTWGGADNGFTIENIGNVNVSLGLASTQDAAAYLGGANPEFQYMITEKESDSCEDMVSGWIDFTTSDVQVCSLFDVADDSDEIYVDIRLQIPSSSSQGERTATITATGTYSE